MSLPGRKSTWFGSAIYTPEVTFFSGGPGRENLYYPANLVAGLDNACIPSWGIQRFAEIQLRFIIRARRLILLCVGCFRITSIISSGYMMSGLQRSMVFIVRSSRMLSGRTSNAAI